MSISLFFFFFFFALDWSGSFSLIAWQPHGAAETQQQCRQTWHRPNAKEQSFDTPDFSSLSPFFFFFAQMNKHSFYFSATTYPEVVSVIRCSAGRTFLWLCAVILPVCPSFTLESHLVELSTQLLWEGMKAARARLNSPALWPTLDELCQRDSAGGRVALLRCSTGKADRRADPIWSSSPRADPI